MKHALMKGSTDNVSVVIVFFERLINFLNTLRNPANIYFRINFDSHDDSSHIAESEADHEFDKLVLRKKIR